MVSALIPLSTQAYIWVPANLMLGVTLQGTSIPFRGGGEGGEETLLATSCYRNWDKLQPDRPLGRNADLTNLTHTHAISHLGLHPFSKAVKKFDHYETRLAYNKSYVFT